MSSLVEELQRDALDRRAGVSDLLRKAKTIAFKLDLPELEKWVQSESGGYKSGDVPDYRVLVGHVKGRNPFHGWQPVQFGDSATELLFSKQRVCDSVAELESLVANAGMRELMLPQSAEAKQMLRAATGFDFDFTVVIPPSALAGILDAVRNALLEWALKLEKSGVRGEGMSFSPDERKRAHEAQAVYNIGTIQTFTGNMGSGSGNFSVQANVVNADSKAVIQELIGRIRSNESQLGLESGSAEKLNQALDGLEDEIEVKKPSAERIRDFLASIRNIAEGAVGSLAAQGILYELAKLMK